MKIHTKNLIGSNLVVLNLRTGVRAGLRGSRYDSKKACQAGCISKRDWDNILCFLAKYGGYQGECGASESDLQTCLANC